MVRTVVDRLAGDGERTVSTEMRAAQSAGTHQIEVRNDAGEISRVSLDVRFKPLHVLPPIGKQKRDPPLDLTGNHCTELAPTQDRTPPRRQALTQHRT